ncbi:MAG TPA: sugar ABC transporter substrate-binding protein [Anaeromyxobacter sp.]|nr:sugar ABC transporter substrate-binding protein [Anaeromyxobacter sp.]
MRLLRSAVCLVAVLVAGTALGQAKKSTTFFGTAIRSLENPYHGTWARGGQAAADALGGVHVVQTCEGSSEKQLNDIKALVAKAGKDAVFCIDPNEAPNVVPIAKALDQAGIYFVTWWNKPDDVKVWNNPHWVAHIAYDGISAGEFTAKALFEKMGGKGKFVAIQGMLANTTAIDRFKGLQNVLAKYPDVKMVAQDTAEWDRSKAFDKMKSFLVANPDITGVWAANDNMAMGALEALRAAGLAGKVMVTGVDGIPEMLEAVKKGEAAATVLNDSFWQGGIGLSLAYAVKTGKIDLKNTPKEKRQYFAKAVEVDQANVDQILNRGTPKIDWTDYYANYVRPMP